MLLLLAHSMLWGDRHGTVSEVKDVSNSRQQLWMKIKLKLKGKVMQ